MISYPFFFIFYRSWLHGGFGPCKSGGFDFQPLLYEWNQTEREAFAPPELSLANNFASSRRDFSRRMRRMVQIGGGFGGSERRRGRSRLVATVTAQTPVQGPCSRLGFWKQQLSVHPQSPFHTHKHTPAPAARLGAPKIPGRNEK